MSCKEVIGNDPTGMFNNCLVIADHGCDRYALAVWWQVGESLPHLLTVSDPERKRNDTDALLLALFDLSGSLFFTANDKADCSS